MRKCLFVLCLSLQTLDINGLMAKAVVIQLPNSYTLYFSSYSSLSLVWPIPQIIYLGVTVSERSEPKRNYIDVCVQYVQLYMQYKSRNNTFRRVRWSFHLPFIYILLIPKLSTFEREGVTQ